VRVVVSVESSDPSRVVRLLDPADGSVSFRIKGPNTNRQKVKDALVSLPALQLGLPASALATPGDRDIPGSIINDLDLFRTNGVTVSEVSPATLRFNVDQVTDVEVDVQAAPNGPNILGFPVFTPRRVHIKAPDAVINTAKAAKKLVAYAHLDEAHEALTQGPNDLTVVPLTVPFGDRNVTIAPATVLAHVEIKKSEMSLTRSSIPVWVNYAPGADDKFKAVNEPIITKVTVIGPEEEILALQDPSFPTPPKAWFEVTGNDKADIDIERRLHFDLPPGVRPSPEDAKRTITFHLVERKGE